MEEGKKRETKKKESGLERNTDKKKDVSTKQSLIKFLHGICQHG